MKTLLLAALFSVSALTFSAHGANPDVPVTVSTVTDAQLMGRWISTVPIFSGNGMTVHLGLEIKTSTGVMSSICSFPGGKTVEAHIEVPIRAGAGSIQVLSTGRNEVRDGGYTCNVEIQTGVVGYSFVGAQLRLNSNGHNLDFNRR